MNTKLSSERVYRKVRKYVLSQVNKFVAGGGKLLSFQYGIKHSYMHPACLVGAICVVAGGDPSWSEERLLCLNSEIQKLGISSEVADKVIVALEHGFEAWYPRNPDRHDLYREAGFERLANFARRLGIQHGVKVDKAPVYANRS